MPQPKSDTTTPQEAATERRGPGRPKDGIDLRDTILDHAELAFASAGYNGARMRDIAARAGVNQASSGIISGQSKTCSTKSSGVAARVLRSIARHC